MVRERSTKLYATNKIKDFICFFAMVLQWLRYIHSLFNVYRFLQSEKFVWTEVLGSTHLNSEFSESIQISHSVSGLATNKLKLNVIYNMTNRDYRTSVRIFFIHKMFSFHIFSIFWHFIQATPTIRGYPGPRTDRTTKWMVYFVWIGYDMEHLLSATSWAFFVCFCTSYLWR